MSAATPRIASNAPELRQLGIAVAALILAVALVVAATVARQSSVQSVPLPGSAPAPAVHDHGWSDAAGATKGLVVAGSTGGAIQYTGIPYPNGTLIVGGTKAGGIQYNGIPYPALDNSVGGGPRGTRIAQ
jgi:hypothetical protein